jgi:hypothetical protein
MSQQLEAVYEHQALCLQRPPVPKELQIVKPTFPDVSTGSQRDMEVEDRPCAEVAALETGPAIDEVRAAVAFIPEWSAATGTELS